MTDITDQQRREMATRLREGEGLYSALESMFDPELIATDVLADLIDRPMCEDIGTTALFRCSACGCELCVEVYGSPVMWTRDGTAVVPRFCPNCGAEVV
jgi:hypothetical protein